MSNHKVSFSFVLIVYSLLFINFVTFVVDAFIHPVGEKEYEVLIKLAAGQFSTPKNERSNIEKAAIVKFWRAKGKFSVDESGKVLYFDNKVVRN